MKENEKERVVERLRRVRRMVGRRI